MPIIPDSLPGTLALHTPAAGPDAGGAAGSLDQAAALWAARARAAEALAEPPDPVAFPDPQAFADALEDWRGGLEAAAEESLEGRPHALDAWRAWFSAELARLGPYLEQAALAAAVQRAGAALRRELDAAAGRALDPARPGDAEAASSDARAALEQAVALGVLDDVEAERTAQGLAARVQAGLAAARADQDPANFLRELQAGDFPVLDQAGRGRLKERAALRLALAQAQAEQEAVRQAADARRLPAERGRFLLRRAEAALRAALGDGDPADVQDAALELATWPGFTAQARDLAKSLETLPAARALLGRTACDPTAARFAALDAAAEGWPAPLARTCREVLDESAADLARDPAGYVRAEAERRLKALGLDPATEREALLHAVLDLEAQAGVEEPCVLSLAENTALRQEWRGRDAAGRVAFLTSLAGFAGFRHRVAAEVLGARGPVLLLAAESPALCPAEKTELLAVAHAPAPDGPLQEFPELSALAASEPQAAAVLADLAHRLAAAGRDPDDARRLLAALAPEALRLWGQAPSLTPQSEHESAYRQGDGLPYPPTGDENAGPAKPKAGEDTLQGGVGEETLVGGEDGQAKGESLKDEGAPVLRNPTGGHFRVEDSFGKGDYGARRVDGKVVYSHRGIDIQGGIGDEVKAPMSGTVTLGKKNEVVISASDKDGNLYSSVLAHVDHDLKPGKQGIKVIAGDVVGTVQDPSKYITKGDPKDMTPHAHLGLYKYPKSDRKNREVLDPNDYLATRLYDRNHRPLPLNGKIAR